MTDIAKQIAKETYTDATASRHTKRQWLDGVKWCLKRGMAAGDIRNHLQAHVEA